MALVIRDTNTTPREKQWCYPGVDGKLICQNSHMNILREVQMHYRANGQTPPDEQTITKYLCENLTIPCFEGRDAFRNNFTDPVSYASRGAPSPNWPILLQPFRLLAKEGDKGLGDIVHRMIGDANSDKYKAWHMRIFGKPCGCSERQNSLNEEFPL